MKLFHKVKFNKTRIDLH